jgi:monofunctional biosynthetic peptidoglycan transglycosylase
MEPPAAKPEKKAPAKPRRRWRGRLIVLALVLSPVLVPVVDSYVRCPVMLYYRFRYPSRTAFMEFRQEQAREQKRPFRLRWTVVPLTAISQPMRRAVILAEDDKFWQHEGFDVEAMKKAYAANQRRGKIRRGGSTISQQVAKNLWLSPERSYYRKVVEAVLAWRMEHALSKQRILEIYLNVIEWGPGIFGIAAASQAYYGVPPSAISPQQAAMLAAAIPSPLHFNAAAPSRAVERRRAHILTGLIGSQAYLDQLEAEGALGPVPPEPGAEGSAESPPMEGSPTAPDAATPEPAMPEPAAPEPVAPEPAVPEPSAPEPAVPEPSAPEPGAPNEGAPSPAPGE